MDGHQDAAAFAAISRFVPLWTRWLDASIAQSGMSAARVRLIAQIAADGPQTITQIAAKLDVTARNAAALINGLEQDGLVVREAHPSDRRAVLVTASESGQQVLNEYWASLANAGSEVLAVLDARERALFHLLIDRVGGQLRDLLS